MTVVLSTFTRFSFRSQKTKSPKLAPSFLSFTSSALYFVSRDLPQVLLCFLSALSALIACKVADGSNSVCCSITVAYKSGKSLSLHAGAVIENFAPACSVCDTLHTLPRRVPACNLGGWLVGNALMRQTGCRIYVWFCRQGADELGQKIWPVVSANEWR